MFRHATLSLGRGRGPRRQAWEGEGLGPRSLKHRQDRFRHSARVGQHLLILKPHDEKAAGFQRFGALGVVKLLFFVRLAIQFDDQPPVATEEIDEVAIDRDLSLELEPVQPPRAHDGPEPGLCLGLISAQAAGVGGSVHDDSLAV